MRIFINNLPCEAGEGSAVLDAIRASDSALAARIEAGQAYVTDGRGIRLDPDVLLRAGSILRVIESSRRGGDAADVDA